MRKDKLKCEREFWTSGRLFSEEYSLNGDYHSRVGPAICWWNENGQLEYEAYHLNGRKLNYQALLHGVRILAIKEQQ